MAACTRCEYDSAAPVLRSWEWEIGLELASLNAHQQNDSRGWAYRKSRDTWTALMRSAAVAAAMPVPTEKRRVLFTRLYSGREREWDDDNLIGGAKLARDAMERAGIILSDARRWAQFSYAQEKGARRGLRVLVEEVGAG